MAGCGPNMFYDGYCLIPLRKGDAVEYMAGCGPNMFYDGIDLVQCPDLDEFSTNAIGVPTSLEMFWPEYRINYFSFCDYVPFRIEYIPLFKINKTYGIPPLTWKNGTTLTDSWYYSWITVSGSTLYLLVNLEYFSGDFTADLFDSAIDQMGLNDPFCEKYRYIEVNCFGLIEQNIIVDFES